MQMLYTMWNLCLHRQCWGVCCLSFNWLSNHPSPKCQLFWSPQHCPSVTKTTWHLAVEANICKQSQKVSNWASAAADPRCPMLSGSWGRVLSVCIPATATASIGLQARPIRLSWEPTNSNEEWKLQKVPAHIWRVSHTKFFSENSCFGRRLSQWALIPGINLTRDYGGQCVGWI